MSSSKKVHVTFWRTVAEALGSGKTLTEALGEAGLQAAGTELEAIAVRLTERLEAGETLSHALQELPDVFDAPVVSAVSAAEEAGILDVTAMRIAQAIEKGDLDSLAESATAAEAEGENEQVSQYVNRLLHEASEARASDIHLEPTEEGLRVRLRIDGVLRGVDPPPADLMEAVVARIKLMAAMDVAEKRLPQDGRCLIEIEGKRLDLRVNVTPVFFGQRATIRILDREQVKLNLADCGLDGEDLEKVRELCGRPNGVVISNGPSASGKTTLLYSMLMEVDRDSRMVVSVEDPVEFVLPGVSQIQIRPSIGLTFAGALKNVLRQDPDVIMIGELRDLEMMRLACTCAMTGHLVLTTLHADTSVGALRRLLDVGVEPFMVNSTLAGVVSQRLVRALCPKCKERAEPQLELLPAEAVKQLATIKAPEFYGPKGCDHCNGMGYRGRKAIHEILIPDDHLRKALAPPTDINAAREAALDSGMKTLLASGLEKAARGITSIEEVLRVAPHGLDY